MVCAAQAVRELVSVSAPALCLAAIVALASCRSVPAAAAGGPAPFQGAATEASFKDKLRELERRAASLVEQWHVDFFMKDEWDLLQGALNRLGNGLRNRPYAWYPKLADDISRQLDGLESRLPDIAERHVDGLRRDIGARMGRLPAINEPPDANIESLRADGRVFLEETAPGKLSPDQSYRAVLRGRAFLDRFQDVESLPADACEDAYRLAVHAQSVGQPTRVRALLADALNAGCSDAALRALVVAMEDSLPRRVEPVAPLVAAGDADVVLPKRTGGTTRDPGLELDVWQSAWGDFSGVDALVEYATRSQIRSVNLNPGFSLTRGAWDTQYKSLKAHTDRFRGAGIRVQYLYAELSQSVRVHADFLVEHPDLGIDTLVDDSEFTDARLSSFKANLQMVREAGLRYAGFVTLEGAGNSGVSDQTRFWAIEHMDEPVLMSYFGCTLTQQQQILKPYLEYADRLGRQRDVKVAILLGSKSVGREASCERLLDSRGLCEFIQSLGQWAAGHNSFGGLVLETNEKMPRFDLGSPVEQATVGNWAGSLTCASQSLEAESR